MASDAFSRLLGINPFYRDPQTGITHLSRLADGRVMCAICFEYKERDELADVEGEPGCKWDVCEVCHEAERIVKALRGS